MRNRLLLKEQYPITVHVQIDFVHALIFWQDVTNSKDAKRVREPWKILLHRAWLSSILH